MLFGHGPPLRDPSELSEFVSRARAVTTDRMSALEARTDHEPPEVEGRVFERWDEAGSSIGARSRRRQFLDRGAAAQRHRFASHGPRHRRLDSGRVHPHRANARQAHQVDLRHRSAGIATQRQVEQALAEGHYQEIGRERFVERVWRWRERYGSTITEQYKRLGASLDYADERFTMDEAYARAVTRVFVYLFEKELVTPRPVPVQLGPWAAYRDLGPGSRPAPGRGHPLPDRLPLGVRLGALTVATVRPETMLADTAIAVHTRATSATSRWSARPRSSPRSSGAGLPDHRGRASTQRSARARSR